MGSASCTVNGSTYALLLLALTVTITCSLPVGSRRSASAISDRRRNDARALPVVISQYSNVRNSKTETPVLKESPRAVEPESTTATTTTTTATTTTQAKITSSATEASSVIRNAQTAESIGEPEHQQEAAEEATLSPPSTDEQASVTELTPETSDPDTKSAPIQDEKEAPVALTSEDSGQMPANDDQISSEKTADSQKEEEGGVKDDAAKETQKDGEQISQEPVAPIASPPALTANQEQDSKLEQLFEEDRSFKNNFDDLSSLVDEKIVPETLVTPSSLFKELFQWDNVDDMKTNEETPADDKKADVLSKKEKEKQMGKLTKEGKPNKTPKLNDSQDPVDEYEENLRKKRSPNEKDAEVAKSEATVPVITLVPSNYPVVLPNGESTLIDKVGSTGEASTAENLGEETAEEPVIFTLVPNNFPVVLEDGTQTLSDQIPKSDQEPNDEESGESNPTESAGAVVVEPEVVQVPSNFPIVLPDGTQTLSDQISETAQQNKNTEAGGDDSNAAIVIALVPDNFPVVLPNGEQTTSDKV